MCSTVQPLLLAKKLHLSESLVIIFAGGGSAIVAMASEIFSSSNTITFLCLFFLLYSVATGTISVPAAGSEAEVTQLAARRVSLLSQKELNREDLWRRGGISSRRMVIGSRAPVCTFNECRGCRFKCTSEQVPVDANDPMNSAYHYRCVCHR